MGQWGSSGPDTTSSFRATVSLEGMSGQTAEFELPGAPSRYIALGAYITFDAAPEATDADTNGLYVRVGTDAAPTIFASGQILDTAESGMGAPQGYQAGGDLTLVLEAKLGADDPGELAHVGGATTATFVLHYIPA